MVDDFGSVCFFDHWQNLSEVTTDNYNLSAKRHLFFIEDIS